ncbi:MAG TPA: polysaccharide biosynthesis/export family protein [Bryobacteraceae bacterium]
MKTITKQPARNSGTIYTKIALTIGLISPLVLHASDGNDRKSGYMLGPEDVVTVRALDLDEFSPQNLGPVRIDTQGDLRLPIAGRIHASGLTVEQLGTEIARKLSDVVVEPDVTVSLTETKSHPVSVLGAVKTPGVYQITGRQTLFEVLSLAGGLSPDAGNRVKITRQVEVGKLDLPTARRDVSGKFIIGELNLHAVMDAKNPTENIAVLAHDVISVPKADLVYVIGAVKRPGGFVLSEKEHMSTLQALALAEGLDRMSAGKNARIIRQEVAGGDRSEIPVNIERILDGHAKDVPLQANDILFIPTSMAKNAAMRGLEVAVQLGTGLAIYRR